VEVRLRGGLVVPGSGSARLADSHDDECPLRAPSLPVPSAEPGCAWCATVLVKAAVSRARADALSQLGVVVDHDPARRAAPRAVWCRSDRVPSAEAFAQARAARVSTSAASAPCDSESASHAATPAVALPPPDALSAQTQ